jgi:hypothetical protein
MLHSTRDATARKQKKVSGGIGRKGEKGAKGRGVQILTSAQFAVHFEPTLTETRSDHHSLGHLTDLINQKRIRMQKTKKLSEKSESKLWSILCDR